MNDKRIAADPRAKDPEDMSDTEPLPVELQIALGAKLRDVYGRLVQEPLPDRFTKLLEQLSKSSKPKSES